MIMASEFIDAVDLHAGICHAHADARVPECLGDEGVDAVGMRLECLECDERVERPEVVEAHVGVDVVFDIFV